MSRCPVRKLEEYDKIKDNDVQINLCQALSIDSLELERRSTYIEIGAQGAEHDRNLLLVSEKENLGLTWVVFLEDIMVCCGDLDSSVTNVLE